MRARSRREAIAIDVWARENIPDYAGLNAPAEIRNEFVNSIWKGLTASRRGN